jgi:hypothetical protein
MADQQPACGGQNARALETVIADSSCEEEKNEPSFLPSAAIVADSSEEGE